MLSKLAVFDQLMTTNQYQHITLTRAAFHTRLFAIIASIGGINLSKTLAIIIVSLCFSLVSDPLLHNAHSRRDSIVLHGIVHWTAPAQRLYWSVACNFSLPRWCWGRIGNCLFSSLLVLQRDSCLVPHILCQLFQRPVALVTVPQSNSTQRYVSLITKHHC